MELIEIVAGKAELIPLKTQPANVFLDRIDILLLLAQRIGVVESEIAAARKSAGEPKVQADRLGMTDVQVAIGLRRKPNLNPALVEARGDIFDDVFLDEIVRLALFLHIGINNICHDWQLLTTPRVDCVETAQLSQQNTPVPPDPFLPSPPDEH